MEDVLTKLYDAWRESINAPNAFQCFQAGFTSSAQSMRARVLKLIQEANKDGSLNELTNKVGQLSDIPTE